MSPVRQPNRFLERQQARRLAAFIRSEFPRADQVFAYQNLQGLALSLDAEFCVLYEEPIDPGGMGADIKAWFNRGFLSPCSPQQQAADLDHFRHTCSDRVATALGQIAAVLGFEPAAVLAIPAAASAWSRARWTKAYAPDLLASFYTFEDALAAYLTCALLDIPRLLFLSELGDGTTHYLAKLLPLHVQQAALVLVSTRAVAAELVARFGDGVAAKLVCAEDNGDWVAETVRRANACLRGRPAAVHRPDLGPAASFRTRVVTAPAIDVTPFVLLGAERTGSNLLNDMLQSHPSVAAFGEVLNSRMIEEGKLDMPVDGAEMAALVALRSQDPAAFHLRLLRKARQAGASAAGFKLLYYHGAIENRIVDHLLGLTDLRVVHLVREDRLARWISMARAMRSDSWWAPSGAPRPAGEGRIELDPCETILALESTTLLEERFRATFANHQVLEVSYEELAGDLQGAVARVLAFLGVDVMPLQPRAAKTGERDPRAGVANWRELAAALQGTHWADQAQRD